jgi:hypothetical protein
LGWQGKAARKGGGVKDAVLAISLGKKAFRRFFDPILFSNGPNEARLRHFIFQMS